MQRLDATEVLVVGAGPVGMFTGLLLAQRGIHVRIIDEGSRTAGRSYACALHPRTLQLLNDAGMGAEVEERGRRVHSIGLYKDGARRAELDLARMGWKFPCVLVLQQTVLEDLLEQKLRRTPNAELNWNHRLADLVPRADGVTATIQTMTLTAHGYSALEVDSTVEHEYIANASFIVGADGQHSLVRRRLGIDYEQTGKPELYVVYEAVSARDCGHEMKIILDGKATSVMWPLGNDRCRWSFQVLPADDPWEFPEKDRSRFVIRERRGSGESRQHLQQLLRAHAPRLAEDVTDVGWCADVQFEHRLAKEFGRDRCWLAGDAAHQTCPVGMQSMNVGLREAADLAERLVRILRGKEPASGLEAYQAEHHDEWERLLGLKGELKPREGAPLWVTENAPRIRASLPASGKELAQLLEQLGLRE